MIEELGRQYRAKQFPMPPFDAELEGPEPEFATEEELDSFFKRKGAYRRAKRLARGELPPRPVILTPEDYVEIERSKKAAEKSGDKEQ